MNIFVNKFKVENNGVSTKSMTKYFLLWLINSFSSQSMLFSQSNLFSG